VDDLSERRLVPGRDEPAEQLRVLVRPAERDGEDVP
jgi:hypothetical protein